MKPFGLGANRRVLSQTQEDTLVVPWFMAPLGDGFSWSYSGNRMRQVICTLLSWQKVTAKQGHFNFLWATFGYHFNGSKCSSSQCAYWQWWCLIQVAPLLLNLNNNCVRYRIANAAILFMCAQPSLGAYLPLRMVQWAQIWREGAVHSVFPASQHCAHRLLGSLHLSILFWTLNPSAWHICQ